MRVEQKIETWVYPDGHPVIGIYKCAKKWEVLQVRGRGMPLIKETFSEFAEAVNFALDLAKEQEDEQS